MATIAENLQTIKSSAESIKQAIIDKGGTISGDITTWADAISGISGGESTEEEITFTGTISWNMMDCTITGDLSARPLVTTASLCMVFRNSIGSVSIDHVSISINLKNLSLTCNYGEPPFGNEIPALFIAYLDEYETKIIPVKFIQQTPIKFYLNDTEYSALSPMTWEQFVNSETYNPTLTDTLGFEYKMFSIENGLVCSWIMYNGECDALANVYSENYLTVKSTDIIKENTQYICD